MLILELSSHLLEILDYAYMLLIQIMISCSSLSQKYCQLIGLYWIVMRGQIYALKRSIQSMLFCLYHTMKLLDF